MIMRRSFARLAIAAVAIAIGFAGTVLMPWSRISIYPITWTDVEEVGPFLTMLGLSVFWPRFILGVLLQLFFVAHVIWGGRELLAGSRSPKAEADVGSHRKPTGVSSFGSYRSSLRQRVRFGSPGRACAPSASSRQLESWGEKGRRLWWS